jgi:signal transduction histidine kinase
VVVVLDDVTALHRADEAHRLLARAGSELTASLDTKLTLEKMARLVVPTLADWCVVELLTETGTELCAVAHVDPDRVALARELRERYPPAPDAPRGVVAVARSGKSWLLPEVPPELLESGARDAEHLALLRRLEMRSAMIGHDRGRSSSARHAAQPARRYGESDLAIAEELASSPRSRSTTRDSTKMRSERKGARNVLTVSRLRNPLGAAELGATLLSRNEAIRAEPRLVRQLETIQRATRRMERLIGDLLDLASIQAGRLAVAPKPEYIEGIVVDALRAQAPLAERSAVRLDWEVERGTG